MAKYKVVSGVCGNKAIQSGSITADSKRDALVKYYESIGEQYDDEKIERELRWVVEVEK